MNKLQANMFALALATALALISPQSSAEQGGFTLDEAIRTQIFHELKANVESLYRAAGALQTRPAPRATGRGQSRQPVLYVGENYQPNAVINDALREERDLPM